MKILLWILMTYLRVSLVSIGRLMRFLSVILRSGYWLLTLLQAVKRCFGKFSRDLAYYFWSDMALVRILFGNSTPNNTCLNYGKNCDEYFVRSKLIPIWHIMYLPRLQNGCPSYYCKLHCTSKNGELCNCFDRLGTLWDVKSNLVLFFS